jgi:hypothetical protein
VNRLSLCFNRDTLFVRIPHRVAVGYLRATYQFSQRRACRLIGAHRTTMRYQQRQSLGEEASRIVSQLWSQDISPSLESVASHLSHAGSLRKPEMRKLVRELCQAGGQSDGATDDPLHEMEA